MNRLGLYLAACLWLSAGVVYSAPSSTSVVESHLNGSTILNAPVAKLSPALQASVSGNENKAPDYVYAILAGGRADANALAPIMVTTAINGLSTPKSSLLIAEIVEAAVRATPDMVLKIVRAAVLSSPDEAAPAIVRAAVISIGDRKVLADSTPEGSRSFKEYKDFKQVAPPEDLTPAERIVQEALNANPNLDPHTLTKVVTQIPPQPPEDPNPPHFAIWPPILPLVSQ